MEPSRDCACQIALLVARDKLYRSRNHLGTLSVSDRSGCGPVRLLILPARPSRQFVRVRSLLLWPSANSDIARATLSALCACQIALFLWGGVNSAIARTSCVLDCSRCDALQIFTWPAQLCSHFERVRSLFLWLKGHFGCFSMILAKKCMSSLE